VSLYTDLIEAGIKVESHESDLYCPANSQTRELIKKHGLKATYFTSKIDGCVWCDVPFQYDPFWESKMPKQGAKP